MTVVERRTKAGSSRAVSASTNWFMPPRIAVKMARVAAGALPLTFTGRAILAARIVSRILR